MRVKILFQNVAVDCVAEGRWPGLVKMFRKAGPDVVALSEVEWMSVDLDVTTRQVRQDLEMDVLVGPSFSRTAICWRPEVLQAVGSDTKYSHRFHHGYTGLFAQPRRSKPLPVPLAFFVTHLCPSSADTAAQEAQLLIPRAYRFGLGMIIGDINHCPVWVDQAREEPHWPDVPPWNRSSRCLPRESSSGPWVGDTIVGRRLRDGDMTDVAAHLARRTGDLALLRPTGKVGRLRVDQAHVVPALRDAIEDYVVLDTDDSDHLGIMFTLDLARIDLSLLIPYG